MERRKVDRFRRRVPVFFWRPGESYRHSGHTSNVSTTGMFVATEKPLRPGARVRVAIGESDRGFFVEGEVSHAFRREPLIPSRRQAGMGVRFLPVDRLMAELVPEIAAARSPDSEPPKEGVYRAFYADREQFLQIYERDVKTGGLFVSTDRPAEVGEVVTVKVVVAGSGLRPLRLRGKVVHSVEPGEGNLMAGMGLELLDLARTVRKIDLMVERISRE